MKVVVVDYSVGIIEVVTLCLQLRWRSTEVLPAKDGSEGLELIERENPDLVIIDIGLPDMDGLQVLREIRRFSQVPVIIFTVKNEDTDIAKGQLGADGYIAKPFSHVELLTQVQAVMHNSCCEPVAAWNSPKPTENYALTT